MKLQARQACINVLERIALSMAAAPTKAGPVWCRRRLMERLQSGWNNEKEDLDLQKGGPENSQLKLGYFFNEDRPFALGAFCFGGWLRPNRGG